ncbi:hypothetical protein [Streptomyces sp. SCL15-4]|uniref:hypothetical protein n=1 Tax=Streptomyces sp. SCL15-4 TaxID=2967221 RepID=UPI002966063E|nr:hypothetical protein [Streptomyces sp. SCL15-4]
MPVNRDVYRLFTDAHPEFLPDDHEWEQGTRLQAANTTYGPAFTGIPPGAPEALVRWVNDVLDGSAVFRLPTWDEACDPAMQPLLPPGCSLWSQPPRDWSDRRPVCWAPEGVPHPWSVPLARVYERAVNSFLHDLQHFNFSALISYNRGMGDFPYQHTDEAFQELLIDTASQVYRRHLADDPVATFPAINISSAQALIRPFSPELFVGLLESLPELVVEEVRRVFGHDNSSTAGERNLANSIAALGAEIVARGVEAEPDASDLLRLAVMTLANRSDEMEVQTTCRDIALGITTLQDRADGLIPTREVVLLVRA